MLASHAHDDGRCWPSVGLVAAEMGCSFRQAQRALNWLIKHSYVVVESNAQGGAPGQTRRYRIVADRLPTSGSFVAPMRRPRVSKLSPLNQEEGASESPPVNASERKVDGRPICRQGVTLVVETSVTSVAQTSKEPVTEPVPIRETLDLVRSNARASDVDPSDSAAISSAARAYRKASRG